MHRRPPPFDRMLACLKIVLRKNRRTRSGGSSLSIWRRATLQVVAATITFSVATNVAKVACFRGAIKR